MSNKIGGHIVRPFMFSWFFMRERWKGKGPAWFETSAKLPPTNLGWSGFCLSRATFNKQSTRELKENHTGDSPVSHKDHEDQENQAPKHGG